MPKTFPFLSFPILQKKGRKTKEKKKEVGRQPNWANKAQSATYNPAHLFLPSISVPMSTFRRKRHTTTTSTTAPTEPSPPPAPCPLYTYPRQPQTLASIPSLPPAAAALIPSPPLPLKSLKSSCLSEIFPEPEDSALARSWRWWCGCCDRPPGRFFAGMEPGRCPLRLC